MMSAASGIAPASAFLTAHDGPELVPTMARNHCPRWAGIGAHDAPEYAPFAGKRRGHEQMGQFFASLVDTQEVQHFEPREFIAHGDKVVALGHYAWHVKSTGREFGGDFAHVFTMCKGKVIRFHEYMDTAAAAAAHRRDKYDEADAL